MTITIDKSGPLNVELKWEKLKIAEVNVRHYRNHRRIQTVMQKLAGSASTSAGSLATAETGDEIEWDVIGLGLDSGASVTISLGAQGLATVSASKELHLSGGDYEVVA